jgi:hypothetical protein
MAVQTAFRVRPLRMVPIAAVLLFAVIFPAYAKSQHGGGGGAHFGGGGHSGGHSSGSHSSSEHSRANHSGHFGWLHFWSSKHSRESESGSAADSSPFSSSLWSMNTAANGRPRTRVPPTLLLDEPRFATQDGRIALFPSGLPRHRPLPFQRFPALATSGCFWSGAHQVCYFEPFFPLLLFAGDFDFWYWDFGDTTDFGAGLNGQGGEQQDMSAVPPVEPPDENRAEENSAERAQLVAEAQSLGEGVLLLVLNNGATHAAKDYWVADGYLEYASPDGTRSHFPLEALDLQSTVEANAPRGLSFMLRSGPGQR